MLSFFLEYLNSLIGFSFGFCIFSFVLFFWTTLLTVLLLFFLDLFISFFRYIKIIWFSFYIIIYFIIIFLFVIGFIINFIILIIINNFYRNWETSKLRYIIFIFVKFFTDFTCDIIILIFWRSFFFFSILILIIIYIYINIIHNIYKSSPPYNFCPSFKFF